MSTGGFQETVVCNKLAAHTKKHIPATPLEEDTYSYAPHGKTDSDLFHAQNITPDLKCSSTQWHLFAEAPTITAAPFLHVKVLPALKTCHDRSHILIVKHRPGQDLCLFGKHRASRHSWGHFPLGLHPIRNTQLPYSCSFDPHGDHSSKHARASTNQGSYSGLLPMLTDRKTKDLQRYRNTDTPICLCKQFHRLLPTGAFRSLVMDRTPHEERKSSPAHSDLTRKGKHLMSFSFVNELSFLTFLTKWDMDYISDHIKVSGGSLLLFGKLVTLAT